MDLPIKNVMVITQSTNTNLVLLQNSKNLAMTVIFTMILKIPVGKLVVIMIWILKVGTSEKNSKVNQAMQRDGKGTTINVI